MRLEVFVKTDLARPANYLIYWCYVALIYANRADPIGRIFYLYLAELEFTDLSSLMAEIRRLPCNRCPYRSLGCRPNVNSLAPSALASLRRCRSRCSLDK